MEFNPANPVIQLCLQGMAREEHGAPEAAAGLFLQAWKEASSDPERFYAAYFLARHQKETAEKLTWLQTAVQLGQQLNDKSVISALGALHTEIGQCYEALKDPGNARKHYELAASFPDQPSDDGPFYHGTKADLQPGDFLTAGYRSNYSPELRMNHIYFTALVNGAGLAAALAQGEGRERVYLVAPTGSFENDPNVTNKKFPGNPTRSYRTEAPLKVVGEVTDWVRQTPEQIQQWREKLANNKGAIIN